MTVEAMSSLPFQAGSAVAAAAGRTALWAVSVYMRQPLRNTALAALIGLSAMAGSNALYKQSHHHPAPLFGTFDEAAPVTRKAKPAAVVPAERPKKLALPASVDTTGSVNEPATVATIGNDDVLAMQQKLVALGMLEGKTDGLFGPRTAKAIKAFEQSVGRTPRGLLTPTIVAMIRDAQMPAPVAPAAIVPTPAQTAQTTLPALVTPKSTAPAPTATAEITPPTLSTPKTVTSDPLPAPTPLLAATAAKAPPATAALPTTTAPAETAPIQVAALEQPQQTAAEPDPATTVTKRAVQTIAVHAAPAPAADDTPAAADATAEAQPMPGDLAPITEGEDASTDHDVVSAVQRGLNSLGFLHQQVDGVAGEATAKAIRNFEVYFRYDVTGRVTRELVRLLKQNGAVI